MTKKLNTRWRSGGERYPATEKQLIEKMKEQPGWRNGAKVYRKGGK